MKSTKDISNKEYAHYNDYVFKSILEKRGDGVLKFLKIPYRIKNVMVSEYTSLGPSISRLDFVADVENDENEAIFIFESQSELPTGEDIKRFFQYVASLRVFKDKDVVLYILCLRKAPYDKKEFVINEDCVYTMQVISLKDFKAKDIFKNIESKLKNNEEITDEDIASLQLIIYTDFDGSNLEILNKARKLLEQISEKLLFDINEKLAIIHIFDMLSVNMLDDEQNKQYMEVNSMLANPRDRYFKDKGKKEGIDEGMKEGMKEGRNDEKYLIARKLVEEDVPIEVIVSATGLSREDILNMA